MDLSQRLATTKRGARLNDKVIINNLLFADDLVIISQEACTMHFLLAVLTKWSVDFKMTISIDKSEIMSTRQGPWELYAYEEDELMEIKSVDSFKYLGVNVTRSLRQTTLTMKKSMIKKAKSYAGALLRIRATEVDKVETTIKLWQAVGLSRILYGIETIPFDEITYKDLEAVQSSMGKQILGVRQSTGGIIVTTDLGLKPMTFPIYKRKLSFYFRVMSDSFQGSSLVKACMDWQICTGTTKYMEEINQIKLRTGVMVESGWKKVFADWEKQSVTNLLNNNMKSLIGIRTPTRWWKVAHYVNESEESSVISRVRAGNYGLGNRDDSMRDFGPAHPTSGRILICPLCTAVDQDLYTPILDKRLSEYHITMLCPSIEDIRQDCRVDGKSLSNVIQSGRLTWSHEQIYRDLLEPPPGNKMARRELATTLRRLMEGHRAKWMEMVRLRGQL